MEMNNLFLVNQYARGDSFIGREKLLSDLKKAWRQSNGNGARSVIGLNRMGKTSLVNQFSSWVRENYPDTICVVLTLRGDSLPSLIQRIVNAINYEIKKPENNIADEYVKYMCDEITKLNPENAMQKARITDNFLRLVEYFDEINMRFLLIIDEFDAAKEYWKNKPGYYEGLRDMVQKSGFYLIVSRRPLQMIEVDSYGNSCFHNVFPELYVCSFDESDMEAYYKVLKDKYEVILDDGERKKVEEYTGFCPTLLAGLGNRLADAAIENYPQPLVEDIFREKSFQSDYLRHYDEFLKRMMEDGMWDELVRYMMKIQPICETDREIINQEITVNALLCRGYLRQTGEDEYVVFSDDFEAWAICRLFRNEVETIYRSIIDCEIAIRNLISVKMPEIWKNKYGTADWEQDFLNKSYNVPKPAQNFVYNSLEYYLKTARKYEPSATVAYALTIGVKFALVKEYWECGIKEAFNNAPYSDWEQCFSLIKDIRNPLFHATLNIKPENKEKYFLLNDVNEKAGMIENQINTYLKDRQ